MFDQNDDRTIFNIPAENYDRFVANMAKLSRRSKRLIGHEIEPILLGFNMVKDDITGERRKVYEVYLLADTPKIEGWTFVARLDHSQETGNIIRTVPNLSVEIDEKYRTIAPHCDHCNHRRRRRDTYLVRNDATGEFKQVGSNCLADFFGHDPARIARLAEYLGYAVEIGRGFEEYAGGITDQRHVHLQDFLAYCAAEIRLYGWISGKRQHESGGLVESTRTTALINMFRKYGDRDKVMPTDEDEKLAADALEWAQGLAEKEHLDDYEHNVLVIADATFINYKSTGIAASIVGVHFMNTERGKEQAAKARLMAEKRLAMQNSQHVGELGERIKKIPAEVVMRRIIRGDDFTSALFKFVGDDGNVFTWFCYGSFEAEVGTRVVLSGTVKKHNEYEGVRETNLTNCRVACPS